MSDQYSFRNAPPEQLAASLQDARNYTLALFDLFQSSGYDQPARVPYLPILNPPLWELGHVVWFAEWLVLRDAPANEMEMTQRPSLLRHGDRWFDSARVAHASRWSLDLPDTYTLKRYAQDVLTLVLKKLTQLPNEATKLYRHRLALAHEDMHGEAFAYTLQTLGLAAPASLTPATKSIAASEELFLDGGKFAMGSPDENEFVFDNEKWLHPITLPGFSIDTSLISNAQYKQFITANGYTKLHYWNDAGSAWLASQQRFAPRYWQLDGAEWCNTRFGKSITLADDEPVRHLTLHEAKAYCLWAGRRLPSEAEWEFAATSGNTQFNWGDLWEWTSSTFEPYAGFTADAYRDYSLPWFHTHQALRGASFATQARIRSARYRNFYMADRDDMFVGFRTCGV